MMNECDKRSSKIRNDLAFYVIFLLLVILPKILFSDDNCPEWAKTAIWYQIFPERFRNGDTRNDPTVETLEGTWPYDHQTNWRITSWTSDWYKLQPWEEKNAHGFYYNVQTRRYGGDIQGILDELGYLQDLGVTAIYLNPVFESPSAHKYGATDYHHIDNNFGPDPIADLSICKTEKPGDPSTWKWTSADLLFLQLIDEVHKRGMKIIIDGVFNHVGIPFWAFLDVHRYGPRSGYSDWFIIDSFNDPETPKDEFEYQGWGGYPDLPEIREDSNGPVAGFRNHIQAIAKRWGDPNGDGDPSDGIDGWRLDVADKVSPIFWKDFRKWVKEVNPSAFLTGEVWWDDFPSNKMFDTSPWLAGDIFDGVMNYRFADAMLKGFIDRPGLEPSELNSLLEAERGQRPGSSLLVSQNLMGSHDTERFASMVINPNRWLDHANNLQYDPDFAIRCPTEIERNVQKQILVFQFTYIGTPYIYYGDEIGMWGADDPDCRKPMIWPDMKYEPEVAHPLGYPRTPDAVEVNVQLKNVYRSLISIRKQYPCLQTGTYRTVLCDDVKEIIVFERASESDTTRVVYNLSGHPQTVVKSEYLNADPQKWQLIFSVNEVKEEFGPECARIYLKIK